MKWLTIEVGDEQVELLAIHEFPWTDVLKLFKLKDPQRLEHAMTLLEMACKNPNDWENRVKNFSFGQMMQLIDIWVGKSMAHLQDMSDGEDGDRIPLALIGPPEDEKDEPKPEGNPMSLEQIKSRFGSKYTEADVNAAIDSLMEMGLIEERNGVFFAKGDFDFGGDNESDNSKS